MDSRDTPLPPTGLRIPAAGGYPLPHQVGLMEPKDHSIPPVGLDRPPAAERSQRLPGNMPGEGDYPVFAKGSTALGFIVNKEGVMVAVDHARTRSGAFPENVIALNSHLLAACSGGSKDSRKYLWDHLQKMCQELELKEGRRASAAEASKWLADILPLPSDGEDLLARGILIAGWDKESGPALYKVNALGELWAQDCVGTGSGAGAFVTFYAKPRDSISIAEAAERAKRVLCCGVHYAPEGYERVSVFHVGGEGIRVVVSNDDIVEWLKGYYSNSGHEYKSNRRFMRMVAGWN